MFNANGRKFWETSQANQSPTREFITLRLEGVVRERESGARVKTWSDLAAP
jgi:hypothetical protein